MGIPTPNRIVSVDRWAGGIVVSFGDGLCAHFSADLLHDTAPLAYDMTHLPDPDKEFGL